MSVPPPDFGEPFLQWLREETEAAWAGLPEWQPGFQGWRKGTVWGTPLSEEEVQRAEKIAGFRFPPDYRLFLKTLHAEKRPEGPSAFSDWRADEQTLRKWFDWPGEGLQFALEHNGLWLTEWGEKPAALSDQLKVLKAEVQKSSPLIPVYGHRFLVADVPESGNPVLSIYGSDIIVYGNDLRDYLLSEFGPLIHAERPPNEPIRDVRDLKSVRLWGWLAE